MAPPDRPQRIEVDVALPGGAGEELRLRRLTVADAPAFATHTAADHARLREHVPWPDRTRTVEGAERWLGEAERRALRRSPAAPRRRGPLRSLPGGAQDHLTIDRHRLGRRSKGGPA